MSLEDPTLCLNDYKDWLEARSAEFYTRSNKVLVYFSENLQARTEDSLIENLKITITNEDNTKPIFKVLKIEILSSDQHSLQISF